MTNQANGLSDCLDINLSDNFVRIENVDRKKTKKFEEASKKLANLTKVHFLPLFVKNVNIMSICL